MSSNGTCYVCGQERPCCRQTLDDLFGRHHTKIVKEITGELRDRWALGSVWQTCCGALYGEYRDVDDMEWKQAFLGETMEQAFNRLNIVKANILGRQSVGPTHDPVL